MKNDENWNFNGKLQLILCYICCFTFCHFDYDFFGLKRFEKENVCSANVYYCLGEIFNWFFMLFNMHGLNDVMLLILCIGVHLCYEPIEILMNQFKLVYLRLDSQLFFLFKKV